MLHDVDVRILPGRRVAVVGETGSGKSTFAKLLVRLIDPTSGAVRLGGVDLRTVRFASLRRRVVLVPQEGFLFDGSLRDNLRFARPEAPDDELLQNLDDLGLRAWYARLPAGLDTPLGQRGEALSVGERQLVALVRAALVDPEILVLDEATSAVDAHTEARIGERLQAARAGRTTVLLTTSPLLLDRADEVALLVDGRVVAVGTHRELLDDPAYRAVVLRTAAA